jgi:hypothetical protein
MAIQTIDFSTIRTVFKDGIDLTKVIFNGSTIWEKILGWTQIGDDIYGTQGESFFGQSVALSADGQTLVIGAPKADDDDSEFTNDQKGQVRVYQYINNAWAQIGQEINGSNINDAFGTSVDISADGSIIAIGGPFDNSSANGAGHVRVYQYINNTWTKLGGDIDGEGEGDYSGLSIGLSADGTIVAIGAPNNDSSANNAGHVRVYEYINNAWTKLGADIDGEFKADAAATVDINADGTIVAIGAPYNDDDGLLGADRGHVRVYQYINNAWAQIGDDINGEETRNTFGEAVSLSADGTIVAIGAPYNDGVNGTDSGHVSVYEYINNAWTKLGGDIDGEAEGDQSGSSVSLSADGTIVAIGAPNNAGLGSRAGHVRVYQYINNAWAQIGDDLDGKSNRDQSSDGLSLISDGTPDGTIVAIGASNNDSSANNAGHVRVYNYRS